MSVCACTCVKPFCGGAAAQTSAPQVGTWLPHRVPRRRVCKGWASAHGGDLRGSLRVLEPPPQPAQCPAEGPGLAMRPGLGEAAGWVRVEQPPADAITTQDQEVCLTQFWDFPARLKPSQSQAKKQDQNKCTVENINSFKTVAVLKQAKDE